MPHSKHHPYGPLEAVRATPSLQRSSPFRTQPFWHSYSDTGDMPPSQSSELTAAQLEAQYRNVLGAPPFSEATTPRQLWRQWVNTYPGVSVTEGVFKQWFQKYRVGEGAVEVSGYKALEALAGDRLRELQASGFRTAFKLCSALLKEASPLKVTDASMREWLQHHGGGVLSSITSAAGLEESAGDRVREYLAGGTGRHDPEVLHAWLQTQGILCPRRHCQAWLSRDWRPVGWADTAEQLEEKAGDILRLPEHADDFATPLSITGLLDGMRGWEDPVLVSPEILREWYMQYHPGSGEIQVASATHLDCVLGSDRALYALDGYRALSRHLSLRAKPIAASLRTCRSWLDSLDPRVIERARQLQAPEKPMQRMRHKRPRTRVPLGTVEEVEDRLGFNLRLHHLKYGFGYSKSEGVAVCRRLGYDVSESIYMRWLAVRGEGDALRAAGVAFWQANRTKLLRLYHVEGQTAQDICQVLQKEHRVVCRVSDLRRWLDHPAQALRHLQSVEDIDGHPCASRALDQLQEGFAPEAVAEALKHEFSVVVAAPRLRQYRRYKEQTGQTWTCRWLERHHWKWLYSQTTAASMLGFRRGRCERREADLKAVQEKFCEHAAVSPDLVPLSELSKFYTKHEPMAQLRFQHAGARVYDDFIQRSTVEPFCRVLPDALPGSALELFAGASGGRFRREHAPPLLLDYCRQVAENDATLCFPLECAAACCTLAYARGKCESVHGRQTWGGSMLAAQPAQWCAAWPKTDFESWVKYGSWTHCDSCGSFYFNDSGFKECYSSTAGCVASDDASVFRPEVPSDPTAHRGGEEIGVTSRWWMDPSMYKPDKWCGRCVSPADHPRPVAHAGEMASRALRARARAKASAKACAEAGVPKMEPVVETQRLYRIPRLPSPGDSVATTWAGEVVTWPRLAPGASEFRYGASEGPTFLDMTNEEKYALRLIQMHVKKVEEHFLKGSGGPKHYKNYKKTGVTKAFWAGHKVTEDSMPTARSKAAFRWLTKHNELYKARLLNQHHSHDCPGQYGQHISSFDLFIVFDGMECAAWPWLYPTTDFTDTGILAHYRTVHDDNKNRTVSIGESFTRKCQSEVRAYAENPDLAFFLYETQLARKFFHAHSRGQKLGVTADVLMRHSQVTSGYWEIVRDALADLVRVQMAKCHDREGHPDLYKAVRDAHGDASWMVAFPNLFITIAPAEWRFPLPYWMEPYRTCLSGGAYLIGLHMYFLVLSMWGFLSNRFGHRWFRVLEYAVRTEYQGRGTPHWHICAWVLVASGSLASLVGRIGATGGTLAAALGFVKFLGLLFLCEVDVQTGNGRLNYINGYVSKGHDSVDVGLGEYTQKGSTALGDGTDADAFAPPGVPLPRLDSFRNSGE